MKGFVAVVAAGATLLAGACGVGDKQEQADTVHASVEKAEAAGTAVGALQLELTLDEDAFPAVLAAGQAAPVRTARIDGDVGFDLKGDQVLLRTSYVPARPPTEAAPPVDAAASAEAEAPAEPPADPAAPPADAAAPPADPAAPPAEAAAPEAVTTEAVFRGGVVLVKRPNLRPSDRRTWAKLDYTKLPDDERRPETPDEPPAVETLAQAAPTINPRFVLDLARGALAGSMKVAGTETVAGVETTKYEARVSLDKALTDLDLTDDQRATRELMFRLLGIVEDVRPAQFWIDAEGRPRRMRFELRQLRGRNITHDFVVTLELREFGTPVEAPAPTAEETIEVRRYGRLLRTVIPVSA